ncbi:MAG TPA: hypothetical protein VFD82_23465 [Planctomycetota bacterium]|nr:hypothetical protein [Planctomycetota bacterium]
MRLLATLVAFATTLAPASAQQQIIAQPWGLQLPARLIDFGAGMFPDATPVSSQFAGVTFSHASYFTAPAPNNNVVGGYLRNDFTAGPPDTMTIRFLHSVADVSFVYHQVGTQAPTTIRAKYQGFVVDYFTIMWNETQPNNFFGFLECHVDEVQIDFVGDFRIDSLAYNPVTGASCTFFNGSGVNPVAFSCATPPILGGMWHGTVVNTPNTVLTALVYSPAGMLAPAVPLFGGELLVHPAQAFVAFVGTTDYMLAIPSSSSWVGTQLALQGLRLDVVGGSPTFVPLNAMLLLLGL